MDTVKDFFAWASHLSIIAKVLLSVITLALAAFVLVAMWTPSSETPNGAKVTWPADKTLPALTKCFDRLSSTDAQILKFIANGDQYGKYVNDIAEHFKISRAEALSRSQDLEKNGLVEILNLTDYNVRLSDDVKTTLGPDPAHFISAYFK